MTDISITACIPHRGPMLLVDEVLDCEPARIRCQKTFRGEEFFFQGHYPDHPLVPGVMLCECAAQSGAILLVRQHVDPQEAAERVPVLARMDKVRFRNTVHPGDTIEIVVQLDEVISSAYLLSATIRKDGKPAASLELVCMLAEKPAVAP